jgi:hypothetical protein
MRPKIILQLRSFNFILFVKYNYENYHLEQILIIKLKG